MNTNPAESSRRDLSDNPFHLEPRRPGFESMANQDGIKFWWASDLARLLGYESLDAFRKAVTPRTRVVFLASPNNPTGEERRGKADAGRSAPAPGGGGNAEASATERGSQCTAGQRNPSASAGSPAPTRPPVAPRCRARCPGSVCRARREARRSSSFSARG